MYYFVYVTGPSRIDTLSDPVVTQNSLKMANSRVGALVSVVVLVWAMSSLNMAEANYNLSADFYAKSCPQYEQIIYSYVNKLYNSPKNNTVISMIRWAFHDFAKLETYPFKTVPLSNHSQPSYYQSM